ncbi:unnamed protein product [Cuscuta campestris]|uniref:Uncharacterized protein n=1 Tax=Cuscuta campestris TaxID=132261 RepID=A0A484MQU5_9ASTE|nr:unnamed protein product [Cuscuta campestris]VFQ91250.1 unnamed protein product [Cuscuta campestris]
MSFAHFFAETDVQSVYPIRLGSGLLENMCKTGVRPVYQFDWVTYFLYYTEQNRCSNQRARPDLCLSLPIR